MPELRLRVHGSYGRSDLIARYHADTTVGELADAIERIADRPGDRRRTLRRVSRGEADLERAQTVASSDLRSGDELVLALDSGVRATRTGMALATLRVTEGPDAGRAFELRRGESTIGRSSRCDLIVNDHMASRRHATMRVSDIVEVADAGSTNGVLVNGELITGVRRLEPGDSIHLGDTVFVVDLLAGAHEAVQIANNTISFNRPPRVIRPVAPEEIQLPVPGRAIRATRLRPDRKARQAHERLEARLVELASIQQVEVRNRTRMSPDIDELEAWVRDLSPRLWERTPEHVDFLSLRVGLGSLPTLVSIVIDDDASADARRAVEQAALEYRKVEPVPAVVDLRLGGPIGVAGPEPLLHGIARSLLLQAACLHSPEEVAISALVSDRHAGAWDWIKWLPHTNARTPGDTYLAAGALHSGVGLNVLASRAFADVQRVVLVDGTLPMERAQFRSLLEDDAKVGTAVVWLADDARRLPNACQTMIVVEPGGETLTVVDATTGSEIGRISVETTTADQAERIARGLAPVRDLSGTEPAATAHGLQLAEFSLGEVRWLD